MSVLIPIELVTAYGDPSPIPTSYARTVVAIIVLLAIVVGLLVAMGYYRSVWAIVPIVVLLARGAAFFVK
jgi:hypothetical protein